MNEQTNAADVARTGGLSPLLIRQHRRPGSFDARPRIAFTINDRVYRVRRYSSMRARPVYTVRRNQSCFEPLYAAAFTRPDRVSVPADVCRISSPPRVTSPYGNPDRDTPGRPNLRFSLRRPSPAHWPRKIQPTRTSNVHNGA